MPRPLRDRDPENYHLVTVRTEEARIWMVPGKKLNEVIAGILARYQELLNITLFAFCILGNHIHLLAHASEQNLDEYMENVLREIARRVNWLNGRKGHFWSRRYDDQVILSTEDLLEAFLYVSTNAVKHGLVKSMGQWPGLSSYQQVLDEVPRLCSFVHHSRTDTDGNRLVTFHNLSLSPLPQQASLSHQERRAIVSVLLRKRESFLVQERLERGQGFLGREAILRQPAGRKPVSVSRTPRPRCYTLNPELRSSYQAERSLFRDRYCEASEEFRSGNLAAIFPSHCFKPPLHRKPRLRWAA